MYREGVQIGVGSVIASNRILGQLGVSWSVLKYMVQFRLLETGQLKWSGTQLILLVNHLIQTHLLIPHTDMERNA